MDKVLILGLGNILLGDEGLGVRALELLCQRYELPPEVEVCDGDCLGLKLLPRLAGVSRLMVVDAAEIQRSPGTIEELKGDEIGQRWEGKLSAHEINLSDLLSAATLMGTKFDKVVLFVMQPASTASGLDLSPVVRAALPRLVRIMAAELARWGVAVKRVRSPGMRFTVSGR
jgi:hydrogenase maturation protease